MGELVKRLGLEWDASGTVEADAVAAMRYDPVLYESSARFGAKRGGQPLISQTPQGRSERCQKAPSRT